ncbi:unnamed protein product, partial [Ixodes persulcatus]
KKKNLTANYVLYLQLSPSNFQLIYSKRAFRTLTRTPLDRQESRPTADAALVSSTPAAFFLVVATYAITQVFRVARPFVPGVIPRNVKVARNKFVATSEKCACVPFFCPNSTRVIAKAGQAPPIKPFTLSPLAERTLDRRLVHLPPLQCSLC